MSNIIYIVIANVTDNHANRVMSMGFILEKKIFGYFLLRSHIGIILFLFAMLQNFIFSYMCPAKTFSMYPHL